MLQTLLVAHRATVLVQSLFIAKFFLGILTMRGDKDNLCYVINKSVKFSLH